LTWRTGFIALLTLGFLATTGCKGKVKAELEQIVVPVDVSDQECELCGMIVAEQPASRAQVVHRDDHRALLCSIAELVPYLSAPSHHGKPKAVFVEHQLDGDDSAPTITAPRPWIPAEDASYVLGGPDRAVMGQSVLIYRDSATANSMANSFGGHVLNWTSLQSELTP
jgi:nitrous oxide reductase accessory protein NosL